MGAELEIEKSISKPEGVENIVYTKNRSPEIYFGAARNPDSLGNGVPYRLGEQTLILPDTLEPHTFYLEGIWNFTDEFIENKVPMAKIIFKYRAQKVFLVASSEQGVKVTILRDGKLLGDVAGTDIDQNDSSVIIQEDRLYRLIEDSQSGEHTIEIIIENPGLRAFTFTFG